MDTLCGWLLSASANQEIGNFIYWARPSDADACFFPLSSAGCCMKNFQFFCPLHTPRKTIAFRTRIVYNKPIYTVRVKAQATASNTDYKEDSGMYEDMMDTIGFVEQSDPEVGGAMRDELARQRRNIELIASENFVSPAVMAAMGSVLTNKYAEGLSRQAVLRRLSSVWTWWKTLRATRAKELFGADHANVQPHSGAQANMAVYAALLQPGDTVLGHEPGARRPPDPRLAGEHVGHFVPFCSVRRGTTTDLSITISCVRLALECTSPS